MDGPAQSYFTEQLVGNVFQDNNLISFAHPEVATSASPVQPLNRLSALVSGGAAAATRRTSQIGRASSPGLSGFSLRSEGLSPDVSLSGSDRPRAKITCSVGYGTNLYVGSSDGQVWWYTLDYNSPSSSTSGAGPYVLKNGHTISSRKAVDNIYLLPRVGKVAIQADGTLYFLALPTLEPLPHGSAQPIRDVIDVALDDQEIAWRPGDDDNGGKGVDITLSIVKRKAISIYRLGNKLSFLHDVPLPDTLTRAVRSGGTMAVADSSKYCIVNLLDQNMYEVLPIAQVDPAEIGIEGSLEVNIAVIPGEEEFLCTSFAGSGTIGVFVNKEGDPVKGTITWQSHPKSIVIEGDSVVALLRDDTLTIHSMSIIASGTGGGLLQTIALPLGANPLHLTSNPYGIATPNRQRDDKLAARSTKIIPSPRPPAELPRLRSDDNLLDAETPFEPPPGSGLSPPFFPVDSSRLDHRPPMISQDSSGSASRPATTTIAETLLFTDNAVIAIAPRSWLLNADALIDSGNLDEAVKLTEVQRRKGKRGEIDGDKTSHTADLRYMYCRIAYQNYSKALFEDAGSYFQKSKIDPRFVIRLLSEHVGKSIGPDDEAVIWQGAEADSKSAEDSGSIVDHKLRQVYGSSLVDVEIPSPEVKELRTQLSNLVKTMMMEYLRKAQTSRRKAASRQDASGDNRTMQAIDTTLAKLLSESGEIEELLQLLAGTNDCIVSEVEEFTDPIQHPYLKCELLRMTGQKERLLQGLVKIAEGETPDQRCMNPVGEIAQLLLEISDQSLLRKYLLWLLRRDAPAVLRALTIIDGRPGWAFNTAQLLEDMREINEQAAGDYLEHVVVVRRSIDRNFHDAYASHLLDRCEAFLEDDGVVYHFQELFDEYHQTRPNLTYCQYIAETAHDSPAKTVRLKTILFLQSSPFFDLRAVEGRLEKLQALFYERAIVYGRLGKHDKALRLLALQLRDSVSAETYCTQGGEVLPPKIAHAVTSRIKSLEPWASLGDVGRRRRGTIEGQLRQQLVSILLKVYMSEGAEASKETAALLNAQALHLDSLEVLEMVPNDWKVRDMSDFFGRALKRQLHERSHWQIIKAISAGQNMHISEEYARTVGRQPPTIEYPPTPPYAPSGGTADQTRTILPDMGSPDEGSIADIEYRSMLEKRSDAGEKSPVTDKSELKEKGSPIASTKGRPTDRDLVNKEVAVPSNTSAQVGRTL